MGRRHGTSAWDVGMGRRHGTSAWDVGSGRRLWMSAKRSAAVAGRDIDGAERAEDGQDEDLAVTHAAGAGDFDHFADDFLQAGVIDPKGDFDLGEEGERILGGAVLAEIAFLPPVAFHLADAECFDGGPFEAFEHLFGQVRLDDRDDLLHGCTPEGRVLDGGVVS